MAEKLLSTSDTKLIQYLNEAFGKEKELETALQAHIKMASGRALQEAPSGASEGDQGAGAQPGAPHQAARRQGRGVNLPGPDVAPRPRRRRPPPRRRASARAKGPRARAARHRRGREAAQERQDRALERVRGDRATTSRSRSSPRRSATRRPRSSRATIAARRSAWRRSSQAADPAARRKAVVTEEIPASERRSRRAGARVALARQAGDVSRQAVHLALLDHAREVLVNAREAGRVARQVAGSPHDEPQPHAHRSQVVLTSLRRSAAQEQPGDDPADGVPDDRRDAPVDGLLSLAGIER